MKLAVLFPGIGYTVTKPLLYYAGRLAASDVKGQARQVFQNLQTVLEELNLSMADILKTTVFMTDLGAFAAVNEIYATYFGPDYPARSCVQVSALPMGARIEVEAVASANERLSF